VTGDASVLTEKSARIVAAHRLLRRSRRTEAGEFLAEGAQAVREAIGYQGENPGTLVELYVTEAAASRNTDLIRSAFAAGVQVTQVTERAAAALSDTQAPQGIVALCRSIEVDLGTALSGSPKLVAVLVQTNDPGNAGTIIRLADAVGADAVIFAGDAVDPFNPKVVRASTGSLFHLPIARATDPLQLLAVLSEAGLSTLATTGGAELELDAARADGLLDLPTAWLFGSEAHGLPTELVVAADASIRVPIHGRAESLNLATAAAVCLYASAGAQRG
jgi:TrmH family RNA methyltransferase